MSNRGKALLKKLNYRLNQISKLNQRLTKNNSLILLENILFKLNFFNFDQNSSIYPIIRLLLYNGYILYI